MLQAIPLDGKPFNGPNPKRLYGVTWILANDYSTAVIATTGWVGTERQIKTALQDPRSREVITRWRLRKNTLAWRIGSPPGAVFIGVVAPADRESRAPNRAGDWDDMRAALSELAGLSEAPKASLPAKPTLAKLRRTTWFASWRRQVPAPTIRAARAILGEAVEALGELATPPPAQKTLALLKKAMRAINTLERREHFITTIEAEDVVEALKAIAAAGGIDEQTFELKVDVLRDF